MPVGVHDLRDLVEPDVADTLDDEGYWRAPLSLQPGAGMLLNVGGQDWEADAAEDTAAPPDDDDDNGATVLAGGSVCSDTVTVTVGGEPVGEAGVDKVALDALEFIEIVVDEVVAFHEAAS